MKSKTLLFGWAFFMLCTNLPAMAEDDPGFGIGAFAAYYNTSSSTFIDADANFETAPVFGGLLTYHFTSRYSVELWATQYESDMDLAFDDKSAKFGEIEQIPILLTGRFQFPIRKSSSNIYLGLGVGYIYNTFDHFSRSELEEFFAVNVLEADIDSGFSWHVNAGTEMRFWKNYSAFIDLKAIFHQPNFDVTFEDGTTAEKDVGINASVLSVGLKYYF